MDKDCYNCFICWESFSLSDKKEASKVISCCRCNHNDYKYAHIECLRYWVNSLNGSNKKCNICCTPYIIQKSKVPLSTLLKSHWVVVYFYVLFLISTFIISVLSWAKYMLPIIVYIVTPQFNNEFNLEKENGTAITYINNGYFIRFYVIFQTVVFIFSIVYVGRMLLNYVEKDNKNNKLIGISPSNQIVLVDLRKKKEEEDDDDDLKERREKLKMNLIEIFSFIKEKVPFIKHNNKYKYNNTSLV
jgi:hypothetical protein